jgi:two-component system response regulator DesR
MIRVLIAEDMHMIRGALVALLRLERDIDVVAELDRGDAIIDAALRTQPHVAVIDIDLPGLDGLSATAELHARLPSCHALILTGLSQPGHLLRALQVHARGFLLKDAPAARLANAIRAVHAGQRVLDPELVAAAVEAGPSPLTEREAEVLRAARSGMASAEIGNKLNLSPATVRNYLSNTIAKLGARNRLDAIRAAEDAGWL